MSQLSLEVLVEDDGFLFGRLGALGVLLWFKTPTAYRAEQVSEHFASIGRGHDFALLTVVTPPCAPVGPDVRSAFDEGIRDSRETLLGIATVIQVKGVFGGLTRTIARTMSIITRAPYPNNVYSTVSDAAEWLSSLIEQCAPAVTAQLIVDTISPRLTEP